MKRRIVGLESAPITRRQAIATAAALGAALAWPLRLARTSRSGWRERRDLYPHGVASGDPHPDSVLLWTRRPPVNGSIAAKLSVEIASDSSFRHVVSESRTPIDATTDWTCRILVTGLAPSREYWYRFTDEHGFGSRVGRTITAPSPKDGRAVQFAFVSCQNVQQGACNAYRRMIWEDERRAPAGQLGFVLHLGDFVYEIVWYPEDRPQGMYARRLRDIVRYAHGEKHVDFHVPTTVDDYRALYRAYLLDPDLQDARARWPFVYMPDNHEFSWKGWQSQESFEGGVIPAQTRKVAANQAWFEYQPARVARPRANEAAFHAPNVVDSPLQLFDDHGLGLDAGNLAAIESLTTYRTIDYGRHVALLLTDNRSFRSEPLGQRSDLAAFQPTQFPAVVSEDVTEILDAGRAMNGGDPPATISFGGSQLPNPRRSAPPQSMLGAKQKAWFLDHLAAATATWKLWGNSVASLDWRVDFQNLPDGAGPRWPTTGFALLGNDDWSGYRHERREIFDFIRDRGIAGVATICGDRHAFLAGLASSQLPPRMFTPVAAEFVTGSISAPGIFEAMEYGLPQTHPLRPIYVHEPASGPAQPAINFSMLHGVRASLELHRTGDIVPARAATNPDVAPHLSFVDVGGHGYAVVRASASDLTVEFVCIPRPVERSDRVDGGPLAYRITHRVRHWAPGAMPMLEQVGHEGQLPLGL
jgi:alkaline phosphatase D